jgi:hypothetical protein
VPEECGVVRVVGRGVGVEALVVGDERQYAGELGLGDRTDLDRVTIASPEPATTCGRIASRDPAARCISPA